MGIADSYNSTEIEIRSDGNCESSLGEVEVTDG